MMRLALFALGLVLLTTSVAANSDPPIDFGQFVRLTNDVHLYRANRIIDLDEFLRRQKDENAIVLDARSRAAYEWKHIKGAVHLTLADFTDEKLAQVVPNKDAAILIYCNNNIGGSPLAFPLKRESLALNIATFINLYGSDYRNVYELGELVADGDPRLNFAGSLVEPQNRSQAQARVIPSPTARGVVEPSQTVRATGWGGGTARAHLEKKAR